MKTRKEMDPAYEWDLTSLYDDDSAWEKEFPVIEEETKKAAAFEGTLKDAKTIRAFLDVETQLMRDLNNVYTYAFLRQSEDTADPQGQMLVAKAAMLYTKCASALAFADPEILSLPEDGLKEITASEELAPYRFVMQQLIDQKPHVLSAKEEQLLASFSEVFGAPKNAADALMDADLKFAPALDSKGESHEVTGSNFILLQQSSDRTLRKNAFFSFYGGYVGHINTFAATYAGAVKAATTEAAVRHYASSREASMAGEHIPVSVYDNLVSMVRKHMPAMYRYVALRKKILKVDELHYYDVYVPLTKKADSSWTYEEAQDLVLKALAPLGKDYTGTVRNAFHEGWIDVYPNQGKAGGAYSSGTYDSKPYICMNYTGDYESVSTIAHEMGHSMQTWYSKHTQPAQYADYTLFVAEVASTVNENLLVEYLLSKAEKPEEKLFLLNQYLEGFKATVYRQTMFAEFEQKAHALAESGGALTVAALNEIYGNLIRDYFGPDLVIDDEVKSEWARIPHFYRPFYVYKYATDYSAAVDISERILKDGDRAVKPYIEFLSMGGSDYALEELKHAGVDLSSPEPIDAALNKFEKILDEAEKVVAEMEKQ